MLYKKARNIVSQTVRIQFWYHNQTSQVLARYVIVQLENEGKRT